MADFVPAIILKNRGVPVRLGEVDDDGHLRSVSEDDDADYVTRKVYLRFDANSMADLEEAFDGIEAGEQIIEYEIMTDDDGEPMRTEEGAIRRQEVLVGTQRTAYYGMQGFEMALTIKPNSAVRVAMACALHCYPDGIDEMAKEMLPDEDYKTAVQVAFNLASGVDPTVAAKILKVGKVAAEELRDRQIAGLMEGLDLVQEVVDIPGIPGSEDGSEPEPELSPISGE